MSDAPGRPGGATGLLIALATMALAGPAAAQQIDLLATPTSATLPAPDATDFEIGLVPYAGTIQLVVDVKNTNKPWSLYVRTTDPDLGGYGKPVDDLLWRVQGSGPWRSIGPADDLVLSSTGDRTVVVEVAIALDYAADLPDAYAGDLLFRVSHDP